MKSIRKNEALKADKQSPGCLGRMVNLFDLSAGVSANRLLTDKPHCEGSHVKRQPEVLSTVGTSAGNKLEDKMLYPGSRSMRNRNSHSTPMKMLIAQEMSKEFKSKHVPPNAIAKLMGLDDLPQQQHDVVKRGHSKDYSHRILSHSGEPTQYWVQERDISDKRMKWKAHDGKGHGDYTDVYEIRKKNQKMNSLRGKSPQRGMYSEKEAKSKMDLVRQKFMEAKRLATNEKLRRSKEFQDAVEVLSSNKEFFLKFLQEPNGLISKHLYKWQSICAPPETRRITVLKPSKMVNLERFPTREEKNEYPIKSPAQVVQETYPGYDVDEYANQPTRIVVLKPNAGKMCEIKSSVSVSYTSPGMLHGENAFEAEHSRAGELRQVVEENICDMHGKLMGDWRDETLTSAAFSDKTSVNKSENQYVVGSCHDFEVMSPNSWHSWDCVDGFGSPFASSALNQKSCSPDSSVCREAKKRLSERWAMMASSGGSQEGRLSQRRSNTLAEMLALSDTKKSAMNKGKTIEREVGMSVLDKGNTIDMPVNLQRSKSLPASSMKYGMRSYLEPAIHEACKANSPKEPTKKSTASSFKGKFSSFFFPRNKRSSKSKCIPSRSTEESQSVASDTAESSISAYPHDKVTYYVNQFAEDSQLEECSSPMFGFFDRSFPDSTEMGQMQGMVPQEGEISNLNPAIQGYSVDNPNQPSPISVLELPYEDDDTAAPESSEKQPAPVYHLMSNLISKSPPIESIARTLSRDDSCLGSASPNHSEPASFEMVEQDWLILLRKILSAAGLDEGTQWDAFLFDWHSPDSPLDASLLNRITSMNEEEPLHEATRHLQTLNRKLVFDCVNEALVEITGHGLGPVGPEQLVLSSGEPLLDQVWALVREWLSAARDEWDGHCLAVEMAMREEVVVRRGQWTENVGLEIGKLTKEIELELLQELLDETLVLL